MKYRIPYGGMMLGKAEINAALKAIKANYWPAGPICGKMELEAAKYLGVKYGILANSGSSAGLLALTALELPKGSEVIIPAITFPTIFNIILQCGLTPVIVDSKIGTYNLDPKELEKAITKKTRAIICVQVLGNPCDMPEVMKVAKEQGKKYGHKIYVLEDNCDGWGGDIAGKKVGAWGDINFTSFHAAHIVSMGQGGGVFTNDKELARKTRMYRDWGRQSDIPRRTNGTKWPNLPEDQDARFIYEKIGYNLGPLELQGAMGRVQLKKTEKIKKLRKRNFDYLYKHLGQFPDLILPITTKDADVCWFSFSITTTGERAPLVAWLEKYGIETRSIFAGNILAHPAYKDVKCRSMVNEESDCRYILKHSFWIGTHPRMTQSDREYVIQTFKDYYAQAS